MKAILNIFLFFIINVNGIAQHYFNNNYEYNTSVANATAVIEIDSGYMFTSCIYSSSSNSYLIVEVDLNGDTTWTKEYTDTTFSYSTGTSNSLIKCYDSNYVFCGSRLNLSDNNRDAWLVKLNNAGDTLWTKTYGGLNFDVANVVCQTPDSGYVLMGGTKSFSVGIASDFYLIKTDKYGNQEWYKVFGSSGDETCLSGQITLDGGYILSGKSNNTFYIVKADSNGNFEWQQNYSGTVGPSFVKQLTDSSFVLVGAKSISGLGYQAYILKINKNGSLIWQKNYGGVLNDWFYTQPVILSDGSIITAGQSMNGSNPIGLLVKTDSTGNQEWLKTYYKNPLSDNYFYDLKATSDSGFIMSGFVLVATSDPWLVKVDQYGCEVANCNVGVNESQISDNKFVLYPNPASNEITLEISDVKMTDVTIKIVNILGEFQQVEINNLTLDISSLTKGIYFVIADTKDGRRWIEKFVKE